MNRFLFYLVVDTLCIARFSCIYCTFWTTVTLEDGSVLISQKEDKRVWCCDDDPEIKVWSTLSLRRDEMVIDIIPSIACNIGII